MATEAKHVFLERRFLTVLLSLSVFQDMLNPAYLIFYVEESRTAMVSRMTHFPWLVGVVFLCAAIGMIPMIIAGLFNQPSRRLTRLACVSLMAASFNWMGIGYICRNLDVQWVSNQFFQSGAFALLLAAAFASSLNNQMRVSRQMELA